jgi:hypothetical protein
MASWPNVTIATEHGNEQGIAPYIICASRSTDIPSFYARWFMHRLRAGYAVWVNPFNRQPQYVSFDKAKVIVFWSKNPRALMRHLDELDQRGLTYYFQFTVNDYEDEALEPGVPPLAARIRTFQELSDRIGKARVIWRFDPLILTDELGMGALIEKVGRVGEALHGYTEKLVISFADIATYAKVERNLRGAGVAYKEFERETMHEVARQVHDMAEMWDIQVATCAEELDLDDLGIAHNRCVDDELMLRLRPDDEELRAFLGYPLGQQLALGLPELAVEHRKDPGQREACGCVVSKDIGRYDTCPHLCVYCYANTSEGVVQRNWEWARQHPDAESIVPF